MAALIEVSRVEEGAADARFHLAIAEASHNAVLLHTIRGLFDLLKRNVVTNIGGMYQQRTGNSRHADQSASGVVPGNY